MITEAFYTMEDEMNIEVQGVCIDFTRAHCVKSAAFSKIMSFLTAVGVVVEV